MFITVFEFRQLFGNCFVIQKFQGMNHSDRNTSFLNIKILMAIAPMCSITLLFLGKPV